MSGKTCFNDLRGKITTALAVVLFAVVAGWLAFLTERVVAHDRGLAAQTPAPWLLDEVKSLRADLRIIDQRLDRVEQSGVRIEALLSKR